MRCSLGVVNLKRFASSERIWICILSDLSIFTGSMETWGRRFRNASNRQSKWRQYWGERRSDGHWFGTICIRTRETMPVWSARVFHQRSIASVDANMQLRGKCPRGALPAFAALVYLKRVACWSTPPTAPSNPRQTQVPCLSTPFHGLCKTKARGTGCAQSSKTLKRDTSDLAFDLVFVSCVVCRYDTPCTGSPLFNSRKN